MQRKRWGICRKIWKYLSLVLVCMSMAGCGAGKNDLDPVESAADSQEAESEEPAADSQEAGTEEMPDSRETESEESKSGEYPVCALPVATERIEIVVDSEGRYLVYNEEKYGFMTEDGEEITPYCYEMAYPFHEGLACVCRDGKYGYIDLEGETVIPFLYDRAAPFMEGLAYFAQGGRYGFMDRTGTAVFYLDCDSVSSFQEGLSYVCIDGRYGYVDKSGALVIEPVYEDAGYFKDGFAEVVLDGRHGIIDRNGSFVIAPEYEFIDREEAFFIAVSGGTYTCFDRTGKKLLAEPCDSILIENGCICFVQNGKYGIADETGAIILEPLYEYVIPIPEWELVIVKEGDFYGVLDFEGEQKVPFIYSWIWYEEEALLHVRRDEKEGCLDVSDFSERIPVIYDNVLVFEDGKAVVELGEQYGVIDPDGNLKIPVRYDDISIFEDGSMLLQKDSVSQLYDSRGELLNTGSYDAVIRTGSCYRITKNDKSGFLNERGEEVIPPIYDYVLDSNVYGNSEVYVATRYDSDVRNCIIKTGDNGETDISRTLLKNEITPRCELYFSFVQNTSVHVEDGEYGHVMEQEMLNAYIRTYKLYDIDHSGDPILYFYAQPYERTNFPKSYSGFYAEKDGSLVELVTGYECGGSGRGDYVCLWYDKETESVMLGTDGSAGGFMGYAYGGEVYRYQAGEAVLACSFQCVDQYAGNYSEEELLENAGLFYDEEGTPYTRETILTADVVTEYSVNGAQTEVEAYNRTRERYARVVFVH